jgi:hypothetical protein
MALDHFAQNAMGPNPYGQVRATHDQAIAHCKA